MPKDILMDGPTLQFGIKPEGQITERPGAYVVIQNESAQILALEVNGHIHLPGGGIDEGETPEAAAIREALEEAGCTIDNIEYLGKANQYFPSSPLGPLNKLGIFFKAQLLSIDVTQAEIGHQVVWLDLDDFDQSNAKKFQKWAVKLAVI